MPVLTRSSSVGMANSTRGKSSRRLADSSELIATRTTRKTNRRKQSEATDHEYLPVASPAKKAKLDMQEDQNDWSPTRRPHTRARSVSTSDPSSSSSRSRLSQRVTRQTTEASVVEATPRSDAKRSRTKTTAKEAKFIPLCDGPLPPVTNLKRRRDEFEEERSSFHDEMSRERRLLKKERTELEKERCRIERQDHQLDTMASKLEQRAEELSTWQAELYSMEAEKAMQQLDDLYSCSLCFDILAYPQSLSPAQCGHTFCAACVLKWFLSNFCGGCDVWHSRLECPLCRAQLPAIVMNQPNRSEKSCPFTINRLAESSINSILETLDNIPRANISKMKPEVKDDLAKWRTGGSARVDHEKRAEVGRREMQQVTSRWRTLDPEAFKAIKARLGITG